MARILITGSASGLGLGAATELIAHGHEVVLHARHASRADDIGRVAERAAGIVLGDLAEPAGVRSVVEQVQRLDPIDAVIHNAGVYTTPSPQRNSLGQPAIFAVNVVAPYLMTALLPGPSRHVYLSSGMHTGGTDRLDDLEWNARRWNGTQAYCDSKLLVTALAFAVARLRPDVRSNAVDPGWVPTRMGGPGAPDDLVLGHRTQAWLAAGDDPRARTTGRYWYHDEIRPTAPATTSERFQDELLDRLGMITGADLDGS